MYPARRRHRRQAGFSLIEVGFVAVLVTTFVVGSLYSIVKQPLKGQNTAATEPVVVDTSIGGSLPCQGNEIEAYAQNTFHLHMTAGGFRSDDPRYAEPNRDKFGPAGDAAATTRYAEAVALWKAQLQAVVTKAADALKKKCEELALANQSPPPVEHPNEEPLAINGTYTVDNTTVQAIGGCGDSSSQAKGAPFKLSVTWNGRAGDSNAPSVVVTVAGGGSTSFNGTIPNQRFDINGYHVDLNLESGPRTTDLNGNFYLSSGRIQFTGDYSITDTVAGCGYRFVAVKD